MKTCQRCNTESILSSTRRFRCGGCRKLVCSRCCTRGGSGKGQGSRRWAECFDCQRTRETAPAYGTRILRGATVTTLVTGRTSYNGVLATNPPRGAP